MIKKIKLFFINRKIKKIQKEVSKLQEQLKWIKNHLHDMQWYESLLYVKSINAKLKTYQTSLDYHNTNKERLMK